MTDTTDEAEMLVTLHGKLDGGGLTEPITTAAIIMGNAVSTRGMASLPIPLVLVAPPEVLSDPDAGRPVKGGRAFDVVSIHVGTGVPAIDLDGGEPVPARGLALEIEEPVLVQPPSTRNTTKSARSVWCLIFPRLQACQPNR